MHEIPPEDEKSKKNWFSSKPRPAPKPDPKPKPKPKHSAERERRQVKLAQNARSHTPSKPRKKDDSDVRGCVILIIVVIVVWFLFFS